MIRHAVGLDMSLTGTGVCSVVSGFSALQAAERWRALPGRRCVRTDRPDTEVRLGLIKTTSGKFPDRFARIRHIISEVGRFIDADDAPPVDLWVIEGYFIGSFGGTSQELIELGGITRNWLSEQGRPFVSPQPSQLKKFVTGKGSGDKGLIMVQLLKRWGVETEENNSADACVAANLGLALLELGETNIPKLTKEQDEVVKKVLLSVAEDGTWPGCPVKKQPKKKTE